MKFPNYFLLIFVFSFAIISSCKKDKTEDEIKDNNTLSEVELNRISAFPWLIYKVEVSGADIWNLGLIPDCQKDDTYRFYKDSTLMSYENDDVCSGGMDSTASQWQFHDGKKKIIATIFGLKDTAEVKKLDDLNLHLSMDYEGSPALIYFKKP
ncbi:MAG: hypothetical protein R2852_03625 [Bacteroidia bacterium]